MARVTAAEFGRRLKAARLEAGLSQVFLAEKLNISAPRVSEWERGVHVPAATVVIRLILELGLEAATVFPEFVPKEKPKKSPKKT